jgi:hypothetical protein
MNESTASRVLRGEVPGLVVADHDPRALVFLASHFATTDQLAAHLAKTGVPGGVPAGLVRVLVATPVTSSGCPSRRRTVCACGTSTAVPWSNGCSA